MDFKRKLKIRLYVAVAELVIGILMIISSYFAKTEMLSSFGLMFAVLGIARIRQYRRITKDEESLRNREIAETDERNVKIWTQARSLASSVYLIITAIAIVVLYALGYDEYGTSVSYTVLTFVGIYWVCYLIVKRKY